MLYGINPKVIEEIKDFAKSVKEDTSTLLEFDIIDLVQKLQKGFVDSIRQEGVIIYEKI